MLKIILPVAMHSNSTVIRILSLFVIFLLALNFSSRAQQNSAFTLVADPANSKADEVKRHILEIKQGIEKGDHWQDFALSGDHPAVGLLNQLADEHEFRALRPAQQVYLINGANHTYEVRDLYVKTSETDTLDYRQLVIRFNDKGQLINARLAPAIYNYQQVLDRKVTPSLDEQNRVINLVERFQHGLSTNDATIIDSLLHPRAHLVEGGVARYTYNGDYGPYYKYQSQTNQAYLQELKNAVFRPSIRHEQPAVYAHTFWDDVYVATFKQRWQRGNSYQDTGYVAMVVDLQKEHPIRLRRWQEHPFDSGRLETPIDQLTTIAHLPMINGLPHNQPLDLPLRDSNEDTRTTFFQSSKNRWLILAGTTAAISVGVALLQEGEAANLPGPPGRPAFN